MLTTPCQSGDCFLRRTVHNCVNQWVLDWMPEERNLEFRQRLPEFELFESHQDYHECQIHSFSAESFPFLEERVLPGSVLVGHMEHKRMHNSKMTLSCFCIQIWNCSFRIIKTACSTWKPAHWNNVKIVPDCSSKINSTACRTLLVPVASINLVNNKKLNISKLPKQNWEQ